MKSNVIEISTIKDGTTALKSQCARADHPLRNSRQIFGQSVLDSEGERHRQSKREWGIEFGGSNLCGHLLEIVKKAVSDGFIAGQEKDDLFMVCEYIPNRVALILLGAEHVDPIAHCDALKPLSEYLEHSKKPEQFSIARDYLRNPIFVRDSALFSRSSDQQRQSEIALFLVAGTETTAIAMKILICRWAEDYVNLRSDVESMGREGAIIKTLVQNSPLGRVTRFCSRSTTFGEHTVTKGDLVTVDIYKANKELFEEQQNLQSQADFSANLLFGAGRHVCPGKRLAMLELDLFLEKLLTFNPADYEVTSTVTGEARGETFRHPSTRRIHHRQGGQ